MTPAFQEHVSLKFQLYDSLFMTLPFGSTLQSGSYLPLLSLACAKGFSEGRSPKEIIDEFFNIHFPSVSDKQKIDILFNFVQYVERQVVLFDAVEDAAYTEVHNMNGPGTIRNLFQRAKVLGTLPRLKDKLKDIVLRIVLTAHPTQFYPGAVLGIITDLSKAIKKDQINLVNNHLMQLGKTPFLKKQKPTPYDEAVSLIWYLENVFYDAISNVIFQIEESLHAIGEKLEDEEIIQMGFWPGGDRDGNPFVSADITRRVAARLKRTVQILYFRDIRVLKRKLTFPGVSELLDEIEKQLYKGINDPSDGFESSEELLLLLRKAKEILCDDHQGIFLSELNRMITKVKIFGLHLAIIDIRQDSSEIEALFDSISQGLPSNQQEIWNSNSEESKTLLLKNLKLDHIPSEYPTEVQKDTYESFPLMEEIQDNNGKHSCHRYIISNSQKANHVLMPFHMARLLRTNMDLDIVPLFETIDDLERAAIEMRILFDNALYREHVKSRGNVQTIMLGFSDGTKDGGYLSANWAIFEAKESLTAVCREYGVRVSFFDGRGGPPARGGGSSHKFYASLGNNIEDHQVQITIQGQTISSNFGTSDSARYNIEQLLSAGLENYVFQDSSKTLNEEQREILSQLTTTSLKSYVDFKNHPKFLDYLEVMGTLPYYGETNIGSRPVKRAGGGKLTLKKLRAIPFVGSWSQMKQNVPGYFGLGKALEQFEKRGKLDQLKALYQDSLFFQTLVQNSMMSLSKCYFPLTAYLSDHPEFGEIWNIIHEEYQLTKRLTLLISGESVLLEHAPDTKKSIELREKLVLPLLTIQQYALASTRDENQTELHSVFHKMVMRTMFGIINAGRNSA